MLDEGATVDLPRDRADLLARIDRSWTELISIVDGATAEKLTVPGADGWSAKDHLAHITTWQGRLLAFMEGRGLGSYFGMDRAALDALGIDALNARILDSNRDRSLDDVLTMLRTTHARVVATIEAMSDADLTAPFPDPDDPDDRDALLTSGVLRGNTYGHYDEHIPAIRALLS